MKNIIKLSYLAMAAVAMLGLASCGDDIADYEPASLLPATCHGLYFESTEGEDEVEPEASAIARIAVMRMDSTEAHTYNVKVLENQDGVFTVPATVSFEAGSRGALAIKIYLESFMMCLVLSDILYKYMCGRR